MPTNMAPLLEFLSKQSIWEKEVSVINRLCKNQMILKELKKENKEKDELIKQKDEKIKELTNKIEDLEFSNTFLANTAKELEEKRKYYREDRENKLKAICKVMKLEVWCSPKFLLDKDIHQKYEFITEAVDKVFGRMYDDYIYYVEKSDSDYIKGTPTYCDGILLEDTSNKICMPCYCSDFKLDPKIIVALRIWIWKGNEITKEDLEDEYKNDFTKMYEENPLSVLGVVSHTAITMLLELYSSLDDENGYMTEIRDDCLEDAVMNGDLVYKETLNEVKETLEEVEAELEGWKDLGGFLEDPKEMLPLTKVAIPDDMYCNEPEEVKTLIKFIADVLNKRIEVSKFAYDSLKEELSGKDEFDMMNVVEDIQKKGEDLIDKNIELVQTLKTERGDYNRLMTEFRGLARYHYGRNDCPTSVFHKLQLNPSWIKRALKATGVIPTKETYPRAFLSLEFIKGIERKVMMLLTDLMEINNLQHPQNPNKFYHVKENSVMDNVEKVMKYEVKDIHTFDKDSFLDYGAMRETKEQKEIKEQRIKGYDMGQLIMRRGTANGEDKYYKSKDINCEDYEFY